MNILVGFICIAALTVIALVCFGNSDIDMDIKWAVRNKLFWLSILIFIIDIIVFIHTVSLCLNA